MKMRGYFAVGIEKASKAGNVGNLIRTAHAFGASYCFAIQPKKIAHNNELVTKDFADTSKTDGALPFFNYDSVEEMDIPKGCKIIGVEISDDAIDLPSFRHPAQAIYVMGAEKAGLSSEMMERCDQIIKIPTKFSLNVATAGAIVMYDRWRLLGGFPERTVMAGQTPEEKKDHVHGKAFSRRERKAMRDAKDAAALPEFDGLKRPEK